MRNKEECRQEENNHVYLEEMMHWVTHINDTRLYWLWMKFFITAGELSEWSEFSKAIPVLNAMKPVTDVLSWGLFGGRVLMQCLLLVKRSSEGSRTTVLKISCLSDFLWGISNFLSAQWLYGNNPRPFAGTLGWWGNLCMEILLIYDVAFVIWQLKYEQNRVDNLRETSHEQQMQWQHRKQILVRNLVYTTFLACGFLLFRGFSAQIINTIPSCVGAGLCVGSTALFRVLEWATVLTNVKKRQGLVAPETAESQRLQHTFQYTCAGAAVSVGLDSLLPFFIWRTSDPNNLLLIIALSLSANAFISGGLKRDNISPLSRCSLFASPPNYRVSPLACETAELSLV